MTLIEEARLLAKADPHVPGDRGTGWCFACNRYDWSHKPDCPWLAMPKIVAALEAAEQFVEFAVPKEPRWKAMTDYDRKLGALVTALRGEEAPA